MSLFVSFACTFLLTFTYSQVSEHCIDDLAPLSDATYLSLNANSGISPNYSTASSIDYHVPTSTIIIGGDFFYINPSDSSRTYYHYFQAFSHSTNNELTLKYEGQSLFQNPSHGKYISNYLRSWTRIIAHPNQPYFYLLGINNLTAYHVDTGNYLWTANIPSCSANNNNNNNQQPLIYNDATFFPIHDPDNIYVAGSCMNTTNQTVIVIDSYSISTGLINNNFPRLKFNLSSIGFVKEIDFNLIPPDITISTPINSSLVTSIVDQYFYLGYNHLVFSGIARIEHEDVHGLWRVHKVSESLINPSFMSHRSLITTPHNNGLIGLLDPNVLNVLESSSKHFIGWNTTIKLGQIDQIKIFDNYTWYGSHKSRNLHLDWTLNIDRISFNTAYVTSAPLDIIANHNSTIAKHDISSGFIIGGAQVEFYALDSIVTSDNQIITVGFKWTPHINLANFSLEKVLERHATYQIFNNLADRSKCAGCVKNYYGSTCDRACPCNIGYCNDDIDGNGECYCTMTTYGHNCSLCECYKQGATIEEALCDHGPNGTGYCSLCFAVHTAPFSIGMSNKYGPLCSDECPCNNEYGICYSKGINGTGQCLYCNNSKAFGPNCNQTCYGCNMDTHYCDNGISGKGCVKYDYGGLLNNLGWQYYVIIGFSLFIIFFTITWWKTQQYYKKQHDGKSIPFCPLKKNKNKDEDNQNNNDLKQDMLNN